MRRLRFIRKEAAWKGMKVTTNENCHHNMGDYECKTWQGENNKGKLQTKGNFTTIFFY
jgi:hypothetical protein